MHHNIVEEIRALHQLGASLESSASVEVVLSAAAEAVARLLPCNRVSLIEIDNDSRKVGFFAQGGYGGSQIVTSVGYGELAQGLSGWVLQNGKSALSPKGTLDPREAPEVHQRRVQTNCGSIIVVPLKVGSRTLGTMTAINAVQEPDFTSEDVSLMEMFADYCAIVIQNARTFLQLKASHQEVDSLNKALQRRDSLKDNLFTILAHDLRGPVGNTALILDMVSDQIGSHEELGEILKLGSQSAHQTFNLLENLLSWVRSQIEGVEVLQVQVVIREVLENVIGWLAPMATKKGVRIFLDCPGYLGLKTDQATLETILRNLLSNAIKYSGVGSQILVRSRSESDRILIEVEDFGSGMPQEKVAKLFGRTKMDSQRGTSGEPGNGLGMMFCTDLAASIDGRLEAESVVGEGSTFRLVLIAPIDGELGAVDN